MKRLFIQAASVLVVGVLTIATAALAQRAPDSDAAKVKAPFAHLTVSSKSIGFGTVKAIATKSITIKNTGTMDANVAIIAPSLPFSVTAGGGSYSLAPGQVQLSVQFAPTAADSFKQEMAIQCSNCNTAADNIVEIGLSGNAKGPVPTPTATGPTPTLTATPTGTATPTPTAIPSPAPGANALSFSVNPGTYGTVEQGLASITVCATGTSNCTMVNDMLLDTGSSGLRIFGSQLSGLGISPNTNKGSEIGEGAFFGSGSTWGSVSTVDVKIAGEPKITLPIQVIDDINAFAPPPGDCTQGSQLISSPSETGFNGLLGFGQLKNDMPNLFTEYFDCSGENCSLLKSPPAADIVLNPVPLFPTDNNGVVVSLPAVPAGGQEAADGVVYFGIGTESNNRPGTVKTYKQNTNIKSNDYLDIKTVYHGTTAEGFFDTGSNGYFFNDSSIKECSDGSGFYCPASAVSESATNKSVGSSVSGVVTFSVSNADNRFNSNNAAFDDIAGTFDGTPTFDGFDWGLPFFFGRNVYIGIDKRSSSLGKGPYTAY